MAQYQIYTNNIVTFRDGVRDGAYVIDKALTPNGFDGIEDIDWENIESHV